MLKTQGSHVVLLFVLLHILPSADLRIGANVECVARETLLLVAGKVDNLNATHPSRTPVEGLSILYRTRNLLSTSVDGYDVGHILDRALVKQIERRRSELDSLPQNRSVIVRSSTPISHECGENHSDAVPVGPAQDSSRKSVIVNNISDREPKVPWSPNTSSQEDPFEEQEHSLIELITSQETAHLLAPLFVDHHNLSQSQLSPSKSSPILQEPTEKMTTLVEIKDNCNKKILAFKVFMRQHNVANFDSADIVAHSEDWIRKHISI